MMSETSVNCHNYCFIVYKLQKFPKILKFGLIVELFHCYRYSNGFLKESFD